MGKQMKLLQVNGLRSLAVFSLATTLLVPELVFPQAKAEAPIPSGLVGWWKGNGDATDAAGTNNGVLQTNVAYVEGKVGQGFSFTGEDGSGIELGNCSNLQLQDFTIETWMRRSNSTQVTYHEYGHANFFAFGEGGYGFGISDAGDLILTRLAESMVSVETKITDTNFHHVAVTKSGTSVVFYLDGVGYPAYYGSVFTFTTPASIGMRGGAHVASFMGVVDELSIYNRPLSSNEIQSVFFAGKDGKGSVTNEPSTSNIVSLWKGEGNGFDSVGTNNGVVGTNVTFVAGVVGQAFEFTGQDGSGVTVGNPASLQLQDFTIETWARRTDTNRVTYHSFGYADFFAYGEGGYGFGISSNGNLCLTRITENVVISAAAITDTNYHHVALTKTGTNLVFYVDGVAYPYPASYYSVFTFTTPASVGMRADDQTASFLGAIDELTIHNRPLEVGEIEAIYLANKNTNNVSTPTPIPSGVVSWWKGEGNGFDSVGTNNGVVGTNVTFVAGVVGQAFEFTGQDGSGVTVGNPASLQLQDFTIETWARRSDTNRVTYHSFGYADFFAYGEGGYGFGISSNGNLCLTRITENVVISAAAITDTNYHHVALTKTGTNLVFYVDGVAYPYPASYYSVFTFTTPASVGMRADDQTASFLGAIDELTIYGQPLTDSEILSIYQSGAAGKSLSQQATNGVPTPSGLISWWKGNGNTIDSIGSNDGVLGTNVNYVPGVVGQGFSFDGNDGSGVTVGNVPGLQLQDFTIETWMRRYDTTVVTHHSFGYADFFAYGSGGYGFGISGDGSLCLTRITANVISVASGITDTNFHHVAVTKSGSNVVFYVDGVAFPYNKPYTSVFTFTTPASIGMRADDQTASFLGAVDELSIYCRPLSGNEIQSIYSSRNNGKYLTPFAPVIAKQPVSVTVGVGTNAVFRAVAAGYPTPSYQWQHEGVNVDGATNSTLVVYSVGNAAVGNYSCIASNSVGVVVSSNAFLKVIVPVSIEQQPQDQSVAPGSNAVFSVVAPEATSYQWYFKTTKIFGATNASLVIANTTKSKLGSYHVVVSNLISTLVSSNATLRFSTQPVIYNQPKDQAVFDGATALFAVNGIGDPTSITSNSLALWLKADQGVETNASGKVAVWRDQSGNRFDVQQGLVRLQPVLSNSATLYGQPVVHFNGIQTVQDGQYLFCSSNLNTGSGFTAFLVYQYASRSEKVLEETPVYVGVPGYRYSGQSFYIWTNSQMAFSSWGNDFFSGFNIPMDTFRIWTERMNSSNTQLEFYDTDGKSNYYASVATSLIRQPGSGFYIGGEAEYTRNFSGDIAELIYFRGKLSDTDKDLIDAYLKLKYYGISSSSVGTYQWYFNNTAIVGATNSVLSITNVDAYKAGVYYVVLSNQWGTAISSNATLTVKHLPVITNLLQDQTVILGGDMSLSVAATGTGPLAYQWYHNDVAIVGATNFSLQLTKVSVSDAGIYKVAVTDSVGTVSSSAKITVGVSTVIIGSAEAVGAAQITVPVQLISIGSENALGFSLAFDPAVLSLVSIDMGAGIGNATEFFNTNGAFSGNIGVVVGLPAGTAFSVGTQEIAKVTFQVASLMTNTVTTVGFGNQPSVCRVADVNANIIEASYVSGKLTVSHMMVEGDVTPRSEGDLSVSVDDWVQVGRFVSGLDTVTNSSEFQRVDCAPRETLGNGRLTITDWVQAGRYAAGLDPVTPAGGPTQVIAGSAPVLPRLTSAVNVTRGITLVPAAQQNVFVVELTANGDENAVGFSLNFDTAILRYSKTVLAVANNGVVLNVNTNKSAKGQIGFGLALPAGKTFSAGVQQLLRIEFVPVAYVSTSTTLAFTDTPVFCELADVNANSLATNFVSQAVQVVGLPVPSLSVSVQSTNIMVSWPGSAADFILQSATGLGAEWSNVTITPSTNEGTVSVTLPLTQQQKFYRLKK